MTMSSRFVVTCDGCGASHALARASHAVAGDGSVWSLLPQGWSRFFSFHFCADARCKDHEKAERVAFAVDEVVPW